MNVTKEIGDSSIAKFSHITKGIAYYVIDTDFAKYLFPVSILSFGIKDESEIPKELKWLDIRAFVMDKSPLKESYIRIPKSLN